jgi:hypothetical protein
MSISAYVNPEKRLIGVFTDSITAKNLGYFSECRYLRPAADGGGAYVVLDHDEFVIAQLNQHGYDMRGFEPFYYYYTPALVDGEFLPMPHQLMTAAFMTVNDRGYILSTMRTGKTAAVTMALDYFNKSGLDSGASLIVCPVSVMSGVWERTIKSMIPDAHVEILRGTAAQRSRKMDRRPDFMIINYDGISIVKEDLKYAINKKIITKVVIDELSNYGNPSAQRYKAADNLFNGRIAKVERLWGLTGTPGADTVAVFGYCKMVNRSNMPATCMSAWRDLAQYKYGNETWMYRDHPHTPALIKKVMSPSIRFTREEVLKDLPPLTRASRAAELTKEQTRAYLAMKEEMIVLFQSGQVTKADQKASLLSKLFQICQGAVITSDAGCFKLDNKPRVDLLEELIYESDNKSVVFCNFIASIDDLVDKLSSRGISCAKVDGSITGTRRDKVFRDFQEDAELKVLVAHPLTTAYGTELAAADQLILNGPMLSGTHVYMQGMARLSSAKQTSESIHVIEVSASEEERAFFGALYQRKKQADVVGSLFQSIVERSI